MKQKESNIRQAHGRPFLATAGMRERSMSNQNKKDGHKIPCFDYMCV